MTNLLPCFEAVNRQIRDTNQKVYELALEIEQLKGKVSPLGGQLSDTGKLRRRAKLHELINEHFDIHELSELVFGLGYVPEDVMSGVTKSEKAMELVLFVIRHNKEGHLLRHLSRLRPFVDWQKVVNGD